MYLLLSTIPVAIMLVVYTTRAVAGKRREVAAPEEALDLRALFNLPVLASALAITVTAASFGFL
jgi:hypothetical protein